MDIPWYVHATILYHTKCLIIYVLTEYFINCSTKKVYPFFIGTVFPPFYWVRVLSID